MSHVGSFLALDSYQTNCFRKAGIGQSDRRLMLTIDEVIQYE